MVAGSSKGTQPKYFQDGYWYKQNVNGYEGEAEYLSSLILSCSNVSNYVEYERCTINGRDGCRSKTFPGPDEMFFSFERLHMMTYGTQIEDTIRRYSECPDRIRYTKEFLLEEFDVDCSEYLSQILTLDAIARNCDRHFNNLGIIVNSATGLCSPAPIFDNGDSLLSNYQRFDGESIEENLQKVYARPFSANHVRQALDAGIGLEIDYDRLYSAMEKEPRTRAVGILYRQLEVLRSLIPEIPLSVAGGTGDHGGKVIIRVST